ncbi:MAG: nucleotidyltransferase domain-containing protein [Geobacter sp.]|nr:nucleotidyltransferase domain-containing protein [Geobacter sp.]
MRDKIRDYFSTDPNVLAVYLFGSHAKGKARAGSDIDLAVLLDEKPEYDYRLRVMSELADLLKAEVDALVLKQCGILMQRQVLRYGIVLFERDRRARIAFEILSRKMYFDFLPAHRRYVAKMEERILGGTYGR